MAGKFEAAFYGMSNADRLRMINDLHRACVREDRRKKILIGAKSLVTTLLVTLWFTLSILLLGWWGYIPAIFGATTYFTVRDLLRLRN